MLHYKIFVNIIMFTAPQDSIVIKLHTANINAQVPATLKRWINFFNFSHKTPKTYIMCLVLPTQKATVTQIIVQSFRKFLVILPITRAHVKRQSNVNERTCRSINRQSIINQSQWLPVPRDLLPEYIFYTACTRAFVPDTRLKPSGILNFKLSTLVIDTSTYTTLQ